MCIARVVSSAVDSCFWATWQATLDCVQGEDEWALCAPIKSVSGLAQISFSRWNLSPPPPNLASPIFLKTDSSIPTSFSLGPTVFSVIVNSKRICHHVMRHIFWPFSAFSVLVQNHSAFEKHLYFLLYFECLLYVLKKILVSSAPWLFMRSLTNWLIYIDVPETVNCFFPQFCLRAKCYARLIFTKLLPKPNSLFLCTACYNVC